MISDNCIRKKESTVTGAFLFLYRFLYRCERVRRQRFTQRSTIASTSIWTG